MRLKDYGIYMCVYLEYQAQLKAEYKYIRPNRIKEFMKTDAYKKAVYSRMYLYYNGIWVADIIPSRDTPDFKIFYASDEVAKKQLLEKLSPHIEIKQE